MIGGKGQRQVKRKALAVAWARDGAGRADLNAGEFRLRINGQLE
jgi:hypothetical protein